MKREVRYWTVIGLIVAGALAVLWRYGELAARGPVEPRIVAPEVVRGAILDAEGRPLAVDVSLYNIAVWRPSLDRDELAATGKLIESELGLSEGEFLRRVETSPTDFLYLAKRLQASAVAGVREAKTEGRLAGVVVEKTAGRLYPEERLASHVVGFVGDENRGLSGLEGRYDAELSPAAEPGRAGAIVYGPDLRLTIDADLQHAFEEIALEVHEGNSAEATMLLALEAKTGAIKAYVSLPDYNPNDYRDYPRDAWYDRPSQYAYEPGSVFKVFSIAGLLELGGIDPSSTFVCDGAYEREVPGEEPDIRIKCLGTHGTVDFEDILTLSCNAGTGYASDTVSTVDFHDALRQFGFGSRSGITLPGETAGLLREPQTWSLRSKPTIAIGQEVLVSAVQVAAAAGALANGGVLMKPRLVEELRGRDGSVVAREEPTPVRRVVSEATARLVLDAMRRTAGEGGTGRRAGTGDIDLGVKTGTAQMIDPATGAYSDTDFLASTLGIFPIADPRWVVYMVVVKPRGSSYFGERIAAPAVREAAEILATLEGLGRPGMTVASHPGRIELETPAAPSIGDTMPDLRGLPKRSLLPLLSRTDISVEISGEGRVTSQEPAPGEPVPPGTAVRLMLE
ncbi:MAG: PASTA domain-containing protein [Spirochaetales bacterium]|nr:PASTA domain-containing protein [Spirochaetales bacterium]